MKSIEKYYFLYTFIVVVLCLTSCKGLKTSGEISLIQTDLKRYNLKNSVKKIAGYYLLNSSDTLTTEKVRYFVLNNDCEMQSLPVSGCFIFDSLGFLSKTELSYDSVGVLDIAALNFLNGYWTKISIDYSDLKSKKNITANDSQFYPCYIPNKVLTNYSVESKNFIPESSPDRSYNEFKYKLSLAGEIKEYKEYKSSSPIKHTQYGLDITRHNTYNKDNLLVCQSLLLKEKQKNRLFESVNLQNMDVPVDAKVHYEFNYDSLERLTNAQLFQNNRIIWNETYSYRDISMRPYKLDRFIIASRTFGKHLTNNATEYYNQYGDITKSINYDNQGNVVRTRFYEYDYDGKHN